jgi:hypothetical protein
MKMIRSLCIAAACSLLLVAASALALTRSKISVHAGGFSGPVRDLVTQGQPRIIKLLDDFSAAPEIKALAPGIQIVGRIYSPNQPVTGNPVVQARAWFAANKNTILQNPAVDFWEGYNEPGISSIADMQWYNAFESERVRELARVGRRAAIGCFATGTPDVTNVKLLEAFNGAIDLVIANGGVLAVHEYASPTMQCEDNYWLTGRFTRWYDQVLIPQNRTPRLAITECGIDAAGDICGGPSIAGWQNACSFWASRGHSDCAGYYVEQLAWYDNLLRAHDYAIGATVFTIDLQGWQAYALEPAATQLTAYLKSQRDP